MTPSTAVPLEVELQQPPNTRAWLPELALLFVGVLGGWGLVSAFGIPDTIAPRTLTATPLRDQPALLQAQQQLEITQRNLIERNRELIEARQQYATAERNRNEALEQHAAAVIAVLRARQQLPTRPLRRFGQPLR